MRRSKELSQKEQLDRQTSYLTFLPDMDNGFHTGYHTNPGVVSDRSKRPREWLESIARCMRTQGRDVGYSIPDVLACEQQLRRLARLDADEVRGNRQLTDYRAVLAILLLWDVWTKDATWPVLELSCLSGEQTPFASAVTAALTPGRAPDGLWIFTLRSARDAEAKVHPIALLSRAMAIIPAASPGDLGSLLPPCVRWYDRAQQQFTDPCLSISQADAFVLVSRLRVLQLLHEQSQWHSLLLQADDQLNTLLNRFADDLLSIHAQWRDRLVQGDADALHSFRLRVLAACSPQDGPLPVQQQPLDPSALSSAANPLLKALAPDDLPACPADETTIYLLDGSAFACRSFETLIKPADQPGEDALIRRLENEIGLLQTHDAAWRQKTAAALRSLSASGSSAAGLLPSVPCWLEQWADELDAAPSGAGVELTLQQPLNDCPSAMKALAADAMGLADEAVLHNAFSDVLLFWAEDSVYDDDRLADLCRVEGVGIAVPPLSPALCSWLMKQAENDGESAPHLEQDSFRFERCDDTVSVSFRVSRRIPRPDAPALNSITFRRSYCLRRGIRFETGSAVILPADQRPGVTVWPNARFAPDLWKAYYVFARQPGAVSVWACGTQGWAQGERRHAGENSWQTVRVDSFPAFVALRRGELSLGMLINDMAQRLIKHEPPAIAAVDFGSISTTVMLRQGDRVQPASLPECMHRTLLKPGRENDLMTAAFLPQDALLPGSASESTFYSVMDLFTSDPESWHTVLCDGHIYYRSTLEALSRKDASALYYDLKWGDEPYARRVLRLFLKQVLLQASLSARLWGSGSISWRVSMPGAMPLHRQEMYLELMRGLARETARETGLPLTPGVPAVLYASENQADGLYFLSRSEINAQSGYLNLDIGGSTADLSLWLGGARRAAAESSLLMGCRQMLFASLMEHHADDFQHDFDGMDAELEAAIHQTADTFRSEGATTRGQQKCMLLLDDLLASHAPAIRRCMAQARAEGRISYLESLLLCQVGFLFYLAGELLQRAWLDPRLKPLLPRRMEMGIAGNGGQLLKSFSDEQQTRLCALALARLDADHPLQALLPVQSRHPKQEAARGLLADENALQSVIQSYDRFNGTWPDAAPAQNLLMDYLLLFYRAFPQAALRLMPDVFEDGAAPALSAAAHMELQTIFANEVPRSPEDEMAVFVRCFMAMKQLWRI